ncbi:MAG: extracellular solute-binding protein [Elusimicrobia bacterium]|nr:extracellular solute-binding protein [Elusimicrobiota bacterium]
MGRQPLRFQPGWPESLAPSGARRRPSDRRPAVIFSSLLFLILAAEAQPLKLWHAYRGGEEKALERVLAAYSRQTGRPVELLAVPYDVFSSKLTAAIPHGHGPDVFIYSHENVGMFQRLGLVAPLDGSIRLEDYFPNAVDALRIEGRTYGYPLSFKCLALYLNNALASKPPENTQQWLAQLRALSRPADNRFGLAYESGNFYFHAPFLFGYGGELFDRAGRARFDGESLPRSFAFVKRLQDEGLIPQETSGALIKSLFNEGRAAMVISGPWFAGEISPGIRYSIAPLPRNSETGLPLSPFLGVEAALVSSRSGDQSGARGLARFLSLGEASAIRATLGRQVPADVAAYRRPELRSDPFISAFGRAAVHAAPMPNTPELARVWEPMKLALRGVLQGQSSPEQGAALASRRYRALYRERPPEASPRPYLLLLFLLGVAISFWAWRRARSGQPSRYRRLGRAMAYMAPAAAGVFVLIVFPLLIGMGLAFFHHEAGRFSFVGLANFVDILRSRGYYVSEPLSFYFTLAVTVLWTVVNVALHVGIGLALALALRSPLLRLRGVFRVLLIVPWAVPNYITALIWKGMFHRQFGAINALLESLGVEPISWFARFSTAFAANVATNTWLGFPFMMVVCLGALQSIPSELYEAAEVDGASRWHRFRHITLPLLRPALGPAVVLGTIWTFNMFNIVYLVSGGEPGGGTDILVSEAYRWAFQRNEQYGFAAAYSVLIFLFLVAYTAFLRRIAGRAEAA